MELTAENLACERNGRTVFRNVRFILRAGELLQLLGPNGSGKSSLLRLIAGLNEPTEGTLSLKGGEPELVLAQQAHYIAHQEPVKAALTVAENLDFWRGFLGGGDVEEALSAFDLARLQSYPAALLSAGQKRRLCLARLVLVPRVLWLLDEPTVGLDTASQKRLATAMTAHLDKGGMIIAATHVELGIKPHGTIMLGNAA